jgi:hypothetical protein
MMKKQRKSLTRRQLAVIEDLVGGEIDEPQLIEKHRLTRRLYRMWMREDNFIEELSLRMGSAHKQSVFILARYAPVAAAKLIRLTESDKGETVRKACLDIIAASAKRPDSEIPGTTADDTIAVESSPTGPISPEKASKMLKILAEENCYE